MKSFSLLSLLALLITFSNSSCKKDDKDEENCKVSKAEFYNAGNVALTANYTYSGNTITKVDMAGEGNYTIEYSSDRIVRKRFFEPNSTVSSNYDDISYNADGTISKIESFIQVSPTSTQKYAITAFTYTSGKLSKLQYSEASAPNVFELLDETVFTYTGNNIAALTTTDYSGSQPVSTTITYQYDTENNYFKRQHAQLVLIDPLFSSLNSALVPFLFSANNPTSLRQGGSPATPVEYTKDNRGNVTLFSAAGQKISGYTYQCN